LCNSIKYIYGFIVTNTYKKISRLINNDKLLILKNYEYISKILKREDDEEKMKTNMLTRTYSFDREITDMIQVKHFGFIMECVKGIDLMESPVKLEDRQIFEYIY
jgi:hypothetical protein